MLRVDSKTPGDIVSRRTTEGLTVFLHREFELYFPADAFSSYADFTAQSGEILKNEVRTRITRVVRDSAGAPAPRRVFVAKVYRYPRVAQWRSWYRQSTAHAEFSALSHLPRFHVPCATPVACGMQRTSFGSVQSCFVITEYFEGSISLRDWFRKHGAPSLSESHALAVLARELGRAVRRMHEARLFVSRLSAKNLLIRFMPDGHIEWKLIDHPHAGFHRYKRIARFMQLYDLGRLKASLLEHRQEEVFEEFLAAYTPDPLGQTEAVLRKNIAYGVSIVGDQTPLLRGIKRIEGLLKSKRGSAADH